MKRKHVQESEKNHKKRHEKEHKRKMKRNESKGTRNRTWTGKGRESEKEHKMRSCHMSQTEPREAMQPRHVWRHLVPTRSCSWCLTICVAPTCFNDEFAIVCYSLHSVCTQCANDYLKYLIWSGDARIVGNAQWYLPVATPSKILEGDQDAFCAANGLWNDKWHVARWQLSLFWILQLEEVGKRNMKWVGLFLAVCEVLFFFLEQQIAAVSLFLSWQLLHPLSLSQDVLKLCSTTYALIRMGSLNLLETLRHTSCKDTLLVEHGNPSTRQPKTQFIDLLRLQSSKPDFSP